MFNKHLLNAFCTLIIFTGRTQCFVQIHNPRGRSSFPLLTPLSRVCWMCSYCQQPPVPRLEGTAGPTGCAVGEEGYKL